MSNFLNPGRPDCLLETPCIPDGAKPAERHKKKKRLRRQSEGAEAFVIRTARGGFCRGAAGFFGFRTWLRLLRCDCSSGQFFHAIPCKVNVATNPRDSLRSPNYPINQKPERFGRFLCGLLCRAVAPSASWLLPVRKIRPCGFALWDRGSSIFLSCSVGRMF